MSKFIELIYNRYIKRYERLILVLFVLSVFIIVSYFGYYYFYTQKKKVKKFDDVPNTNTRSRTANVTFFYVDWCPHCKTAKPTWRQFSDKYNNTVVNDYLIICNEVNCTDDNDSNIAATISKYNIESYPTIKMMIDSKQYEFDTKITFNSLKEFITVTTKTQSNIE
jgi:thiol-disulfide isomerase/thioredoxin